jgi:hypothetical protein
MIIPIAARVCRSSSFTRVTARRIARPPKVDFVTRLRHARLPDHAARQLSNLTIHYSSGSFPHWYSAPLGHTRNRLTVINAGALQPGWTGKLWALSCGVAEAEALKPDYLLFTDADISHGAGSVSQLIAMTEARDLDLCGITGRRIVLSGRDSEFSGALLARQRRRMEGPRSRHLIAEENLEHATARRFGKGGRCFGQRKLASDHSRHVDFSRG